MKKHYLITLLFLSGCCYSFAQTDKKDLKEQFKNKSLTEAKALLEKQNKSLEKLIKFASTSISITVGSGNTAETKTVAKFDSAPKELIVKKFNQTLDNLSFNPRVVYPNTDLRLAFGGNTLAYAVKGYEDYKFPDPILKLKKVYYQDGKTADFDKEIHGRDDDKIDEIKGVKWIDSIELEASYHYPDAMAVINLSPEKPLHQLANGKIQLVGIEDGTATLKISPEVKEKILKVEGLNSVGKALDQSGSSSSSNTSNFSIAFLTEYYEAGKSVIEKIDHSAYKNIDELTDDLYKKIPKEDKEKPENLVKAAYSFRGNLKQLNIFLKPQTSAINSYKFVLKNNQKYIDGLGIAYNKNNLAGILDKDGKWVVLATFEQLSHYKGNYFMGSVGEDGYKSILWLDKSNKKLVPFKYRFYRDEPMLEKYYAIEDGVNGPKGLLEIATNKVIIEPTLDNISANGSFIILRDDNEVNTIVNRDLKKVLAVEGYNYKIHNNYIFLSKPYTSKEKFAEYSTISNTEDIYNADGKKINKEDYAIETFDYFGVDSLILVQNKLGKKLFINTKGDVVIDGSKYKDVDAFSSGLAPVKNDEGFWGYINSKNVLVIPFMYNEAKNFSKISALVKTNMGYRL
ncbi:MAG: WG repeat-containing protein, partial [Flavobacterium sp.]